MDSTSNERAPGVLTLAKLQQIADEMKKHCAPIPSGGYYFIPVLDEYSQKPKQ